MTHSYTEDSRPSAAELAGLPTVSSGHNANLKYEAAKDSPAWRHASLASQWPSRYDGVRFWVARTGLEDGEPFEQTVYIEVLDEGRWKDHAYYDGASS